MKTLTALPVFLALGPAIASAEPVDPFSEPEEWDLFRAEANLVTVASRYKQTTREAPAVVEVIDQQDIRRMGYRTLADVLQSLSGIFMSQSPEGYQLAWIRGVIQSDNNKILLMIDGVPTYDGFYTHAWLDAYLPLDYVRQIEVIKGPGSAIYGTNAFAGVINVVTMGPESLEGGVFRASGGSFGTRSAMAMAGAQVDDKRFNASWSAYARVFESDGDGVERTPRGKRDVQGLRPISASNAGFKVNWNNMHLRWDHVSYSAAYLTQPQSNIWEVLLESPDEFNLGFRNDFVYADMDLNLGSEIRLTPWALFQDHDNPGLYGWITPPETTQDPDTGDITTEWSGLIIGHSVVSASAGDGQDSPIGREINGVWVGVRSREHRGGPRAESMLEDVTSSHIGGEECILGLVRNEVPHHSALIQVFDLTRGGLDALELTGSKTCDIQRGTVFGQVQAPGGLGRGDPPGWFLTAPVDLGHVVADPVGDIEPAVVLAACDNFGPGRASGVLCFHLEALGIDFVDRRGFHLADKGRRTVAGKANLHGAIVSQVEAVQFLPGGHRIHFHRRWSSEKADPDLGAVGRKRNALGARATWNP